MDAPIQTSHKPHRLIPAHPLQTAITPNNAPATNLAPLSCCADFQTPQLMGQAQRHQEAVILLSAPTATIRQGWLPVPKPLLSLWRLPSLEQ